MNPLDLITGITPIVSKILDLIPDPNAKQHAQLEMQAKLMEYAAQQSTAQSQIDTAEAGSSSVFVAGARPFILWVCGFAFAFLYIVAPVVQWVGMMFHVVIPLPMLDKDTIINLVYAMLGLGGLRTFEKVKGVSK